MNFIKWPKIPRLKNEVFHISEKIDGTNACIVIERSPAIDFDSTTPIATLWKNGIGFNVGAQSRTRLITPEDDNYGFAVWVQTNAEQLLEDLGEGHHFGEWWGQGIQRGYDLKEKRFSLFNPTKHSEICSHVPILLSCEFENLHEWIINLTENLETTGSRAAPGYMKPEGLVIYGEQSKAYWKVIIDK
jgi:hypothetical protein